MIKLSVVTLAALFAILHVFGDDTRRVSEVTQSAPVGLEVVDASVLAEAAQSIVIPALLVCDGKPREFAGRSGHKQSGCWSGDAWHGSRSSVKSGRLV